MLSAIGDPRGRFFFKKKQEIESEREEVAALGRGEGKRESLFRLKYRCICNHARICCFVYAAPYTYCTRFMYVAHCPDLEIVVLYVRIQESLLPLKDMLQSVLCWCWSCLCWW